MSIATDGELEGRVNYLEVLLLMWYFEITWQIKNISITTMPMATKFDWLVVNERLL